MVDAGAKLLKGLLEAFLLDSLGQEPKHGYALLKEMAEAFGTEPNRNRLYPLLGRLVRDGLVHEVEDEEGNRMLYALTQRGREALDAYRRAPEGFRHALDRIWGAPREAASEATGTPAAATPAAAMVARERSARIPLQVRPRALPAAAPYPCPDARVGLEKDPATGDLTVHVEGCPIGSYDYCPDCPIFEAVGGFRRLVFGV